MHGYRFLGLPLYYLALLSFVGFGVIVLRWFIAILRESSKGYHTPRVQNGLRLGVILFIVSEIMFFFAFFWAFFHYSLIPSAAIGGVWPPVGTQPISPWGLPLVNTLLLLASGVTITIAHAHILKLPARKNSWGFFKYLGYTIVFGLIFLACQKYEYTHGVEFSWSDNVYGSIFFITTGFHGLHVTLGVAALIFNFVRHWLATLVPNRLTPVIRWKPECSFAADLAKALRFRFRYDYKKAARWAHHSKQHLGFESAAWYWHFVDVVWLFLFLTIYWWGGTSK